MALCTQTVAKPAPEQVVTNQNEDCKRTTCHSKASGGCHHTDGSHVPTAPRPGLSEISEENTHPVTDVQPEQVGLPEEGLHLAEVSHVLCVGASRAYVTAAV
jgi:hypothetical protein